MERSRLLDTVLASPAAVAAHDRERWLSLFAVGGRIEDPVGTAAYVGARAHARFYDTYIATNDIAFLVHRDVVVPPRVIRDVEIRIRSAAGLELVVPAYVAYELVDDSGQPRLASLEAYWEVRALLRRALGQRLRGVRGLVATGARLVRHQGLGGALGYSRALFSGVFGAGKAALQALVERFAAHDAAGVRSAFTDGRIDWLVQVGESSLDAVSLLDDPDTRLSVSAPIAAGWTTAFRFELAMTKRASVVGIGFLEFGQEGGRVRRARFYAEGKS